MRAGHYRSYNDMRAGHYRSYNDMRAGHYRSYNDMRAGHYRSYNDMRAGHYRSYNDMRAGHYRSYNDMRAGHYRCTGLRMYIHINRMCSNSSTCTKSLMVLSFLMVCLFSGDLARRWRAPTHTSTTSSMYTPSCISTARVYQSCKHNAP